MTFFVVMPRNFLPLIARRRVNYFRNMYPNVSQEIFSKTDSTIETSTVEDHFAD